MAAPALQLLLLLCTIVTSVLLKPIYVSHEDSVKCLCHQNVDSKAVNCYFTSLSNNSRPDPESSPEDVNLWDCSRLPFVIISKLSIDCSNCTSASHVDLHEMTFRHREENMSSDVYPPYQVELHHCRVDNEKLSFGQLNRENATTHEEIVLANFGPVTPRLAAHYTETMHYDPATFHPEDCKLISVTLKSCIVIYFPLYLNMKCTNLVDMQLINTPLDVISVSNMMGVMSLQRFVVRDSGLKEVADNIYSLALNSLNHYLNSRNATRVLHDNAMWLYQLHQHLGRLIWQKVIFNASDSSGCGFTFSFAKQHVDAVDGSTDTRELIPSQLSSLDLSFNRLTSIPVVVSLLGNLNQLNLSHNAITSLYNSDMCWPPSSGLPRCYWFRAPKSSLKTLDLSYNNISFIGDVSPWYEVELQYLDLSHNSIKSINAMAFSNSALTTSLLELNLNCNRLFTIELESLTRLEKLYVSDNALEQISARSIPQSHYLTRISLDNNSISDIDCGCFQNLTKLYHLDLRGNHIGEWHSAYFTMSKRSNKASRVWLYLTDQKVPQKCKCDHVYVAAQLEFAQQADLCSASFVFPQFSKSEREQYECTFYDHNNVDSGFNKSLASSKTSDFICPYYGYQEVQVPSEFCHNPNSTCKTRCISYCSCWYSLNWTYSDVNCDNITSDPFNMPIRIPAKKLSLNNVTGIGIAGKFSSSSLIWADGYKSPSRGLHYLSMVGSHLMEIEDNAFSNHNYSIEQLNISYNNLRVINSRTFAGLEATLKLLDLRNNQIRPFDMNIFSNFPRLYALSLYNNSWICSCQNSWLNFQQQLINISQLGQFVRDFDMLECTFSDAAFNKAYAEFQRNTGNAGKPRLNVSKPYRVDDHGALRRICRAMATYQDSKRQAMIKWTLVAIGSALGATLLVLLVAKRHKVYGAVEMFFILKYMQQSRRQLAAKGPQDAFEFDVFFLADQQDEPILAKVLQDLNAAFRFYGLNSSKTIDYAVHRDSGRLQQTRFESVSDGVRFSRTVVVVLSRRFLHSCFHDLLQAVDEMSISGRNPADHIVLLKLSKDLTQREAKSYCQQVDGAFAALFSRSVLHGSIDWEYKIASLVCRAKFQGPEAAALSTTTTTTADASAPAAEAAAATVQNSCSDDREQLMSPIAEGGAEACEVDLTSGVPLEWAPHTGGQGCDVMLLAEVATTPAERPEQAQLLDSLIAECARRHLKLGACQPVLADKFPDSFERVFPEPDAVPVRFLKLTRQFVIVLTPGLARWLDAENRDLLEAFIDLQLATRVTRRFLVFLDDRVSSETGDVYRRLANRRLPIGASVATTPNCFGLTEAAADLELWRPALYRRASSA